MTSFRLAALIPAAGSGSRLGLGHSKGLLRIDGMTAVERVVAAVAGVYPEASFVVLAPARQIELFQRLTFAAGRVVIKAGGQTRQDSVRAGIEFLSEQGSIGPDDLILVHDAARCLVRPALVQAVVQKALETGAATAAVALVDSVVQVDEAGHARSLPRAALRAVQTPQVFRFDLLLRAHREGKGGATDDASLVEPFHPVSVVEGDADNFKITTAHDVSRAETIFRVTAPTRAR